MSFCFVFNSLSWNVGMCGLVLSFLFITNDKWKKNTKIYIVHLYNSLMWHLLSKYWLSTLCKCEKCNNDMDVKIRMIGVYIYQLQYFVIEIDVDT